MLCQNCGKNEANIKYTQIINGVKKQMTLCSNCAKELGLEDIGFNMPINFSSFLGDMFGDYESSYMPNILNTSTMLCDKCNMTYDEFLNNGKFGCENCYETFEDRIDQLLKGIQGANKHTGRLARRLLENNKTEEKAEERSERENKVIKSEEDKKQEKIKLLNERLKKEIKEERYEDAAKTRDEIKKLNNT